MTLKRNCNYYIVLIITPALSNNNLYTSLTGLTKSSKLVTRNNVVVSIRFIPGSLKPVLPPGFSAAPAAFASVFGGPAVLLPVSFVDILASCQLSTSTLKKRNDGF